MVADGLVSNFCVAGLVRLARGRWHLAHADPAQLQHFSLAATVKASAASCMLLVCLIQSHARHGVASFFQILLLVVGLSGGNLSVLRLFLLIGQIHTLSTPAALGHLQDLVTEPVQPWDAVICSSRAGRDAVEQVLDSREEQIQRRTGAFPEHLRSQRPRLPVIPLPLPSESLDLRSVSKDEARCELGIDSNCAVVIWLGRLSLLTKIDPWPTYVVLERVARQLGRPLVFIECGPDDKPSSHDFLESLRRLCPSVRFHRLGGDEPVSEELKRQALKSADIAISLVDNPQETFGLAVAEAMAAGLPLVASDWSGYRDLVRDGIDGFLVPSAWASSAPSLSVSLGWQQFTGIQSFPAIAGALAQLVQIDMAAAETASIDFIDATFDRSCNGFCRSTQGSFTVCA